MTSNVETALTSGHPKFHYEALTFGDLKVGDSYIVFPSPGDNSGHGGFLGGSYLFLKIKSIEARATAGMGWEAGKKYNSVRQKDGNPLCMSDNVLVLKVQ